jgi:endoglucanase
MIARALLVAGLLALPFRDAAAQQAAFRLNDAEYFEARGANVLAFSNWYSGLFSDSKLSGVELIHHGVRTATNGDVRLSNTPEQWDPIPVLSGRRVDRASGRVEASLRYPDFGFDYRVDVRAAGQGVVVRVQLDAPLPAALEGRAGFNLEFLPPAYFGRTYVMDGAGAVFPREAHGPMTRAATGAFEAMPLASGASLVLAPEDPERHVSIVARVGGIALYDGRNKAQNGWFVVRGLLPAGRTGTVLEWLVTPHRIVGWTRTPVIAHSQVGYHPAERKVAVLESDPNDARPTLVRLLRITPAGALATRLSRPAVRWGRYLRYEYARFDFSEVREPGLYVIEYRGVRTEPFRIAPDVYAGSLWQSTLDTFLPVQMDHVLVTDRYRVWHGASHLDDARQAPPNHVHFDLYAQGPTTDTPFAAGEHIPGLAVGAWFDAGDFDLRTQSQYAVVSTLAQAYETFAIDWDETTVREAERYVAIRRPDGVPDLIQQIEHGTRWLLAQYRAFGHAIPGIVEPTLDQYTHLGDAVTKTDNRVFDPGLDSLATRGDFSGTPDDRWAFTSRSTPLNYGAIAALAAASRVLRGHNDSLAEECLRTAVRVWDEEHAREPALFRSGNTTGGRLEDEETRATVELLITTRGGQRYADRLAALLPQIESNFDELGALGARALPYMDAPFRQRVEQATRAWRARLDTELARNPFGVPIATGGWGGSGQVLAFAMRAYILHRAFPAIVGPEYTLRGLGYVLGTHPASSVSLVSGVGARSKTIAYGNNRADFTFIPGGVVPGIVIVHPDFPELKDDWPFLWFENEYVITAAASYLYVANAARTLFD